MHITVYCPECQSRFFLEPALLGQLTRCPTCRKVFEVREAEEAAPGSDGPEPSPNQPRAGGEFRGSNQAGSIEDLVPILPAEVVEQAAEPETPSPAAAPPPVEAASWQQPPPVRQRPAKILPRPPQSEPTPPTIAEPVQAPPALNWEAAPPPVRKSGAGSPAPEMPANIGAPSVSATSSEAPPPHPLDEVPTVPITGAALAASRRRRARWIMVSLIGLLLVAAGGVVGLVWQAWAHTEEDRYQAALQEFDQANYVKSAASFEQLAKDYPESPRAPEYQFLEEYSRSLQPAHELGANPRAALQGVLQFLDSHQGDPLLQAHRPPAGTALVKIAEDLTATAGQTLKTARDVDGARQGLQEARRAQMEAQKYGAEDPGKVAAAIRKVQDEIARVEQRQQLLQKLAALHATPEDIQGGEEMIRKAGFGGDPEAESILQRLREEVLAKVRYTARTVALSRRSRPGPAGLVVVTPVAKVDPTRVAGQGVVFAIARGVLYALAERDGSLLWVTRVGIDSTILPVRVPATETTPELALVIASDPPTVTARNLRTGEERWRFNLPAPCLGRPVVVDGRAFIPTVSGRIYDIDVPGDQLRGWYEVGARLTVGGTHADGTNLLYVPADSLQVYVLDIQRNQCVDILPTGHPAGSLRAEPIVAGLDRSAPVAAGDRARRGYLILDQADGLGGTRLRAFTVGPSGGVSKPVGETEVAVRGAAWFPPCCDGEKLAVATDLGTFSLFGINQARNEDPPLFRFLPNDVRLGAAPDGQPQGRAQVVHAGENDFWLLIRGELSHWQLGLDRQHGLRLARGWKLSEPLGWPLHAGQVDQGHATLFVVTRALAGSICLATAVSARTGGIQWQRRLGTVAATDPLRVDGRVLTQDREGGLFLFDPDQDAAGDHQEWRSGGRLLAPPVSDAGGGPSFLLPGADGHSAVSIVSAANGTRLEVRWYQGGQLVARTFTLPKPLAGTPGVGPDYLVLPLADGSLLRQGRDGERRFGSWRPAQADVPPLALHVVHVGPDMFLATDGLRTLTRWRWPSNDDSPRREKTRTLPDRIVAAPLILPEGAVCVALERGKVQLLKADDWQIQWQGRVKGEVTAGPFPLGNFIACVVDHRQLVWFDPANGKAREFPELPAADTIVGRPRLVDGVIILADLRGKLIGIDPETGKAREPGYSLPASVAPAGTPVAFGPAHLLVPLTDGTVVLVARKELAK